MMNAELLRFERIALLLGMIIGQMSELLNYMQKDDASILIAYKNLLDIHEAAGLQIHELYYKGIKP
jgi:hypothetical protein